MYAPFVVLSAFLTCADIIVAQTTGQSEAAEPQGSLEERSYVLAGYLPDFYEPIIVDDPFAPGAEQKPLKPREDPAIHYLRENGLKVKSMRFVKELNGLILEGTPEELDSAEHLLTRLFGPDMQLKAIDHAEQTLSNKDLFVGERLEQIAILDQVTMRAFHSEVRRLEYELANLPEGHKDREEISRQLKLATECRDEALKLCREALKRQRELVERWRKEVGEPTAPEAGR